VIGGGCREFFMFKSILVPLDLAHEDQAARIIDLVKVLAAPADATITLLNVVPELPQYILAELPSDMSEAVMSRAAHDIKLVASRNKLPGTVATQIRSGRPHQQILAAADELGADLIVVASHQPGLQDYLLGSVAAKVVRHAKCSVHVIR